MYMKKIRKYFVVFEAKIKNRKINRSDPDYATIKTNSVIRTTKKISSAKDIKSIEEALGSEIGEEYKELFIYSFIPL